MKLREILEAKELRILSEKKTKDGETMTILAPWIVANRKNKNGRLYPLNLLQREVARVQASIKAGAMISSADHPFGAHTSLADASHIIRKLEIDKDGKGWMEATILPTTKGKNAMEILKAKGQFGISARGAGTISKIGTVGNDYRLLGIDIVTSPAEPEAVFNKDNVFESLNFEEENLDTQTQKDLEEAIEELEKESFLSAKDSGYKGTQADWVAEYGQGLREMFGLPQKESGKTTEKLTEEMISKRIYSFYIEAVQGGYRGDLNAWKKEFPKLVETASESIKITEKKAEPKEKFKAKMPWSEVVASGFRGTIAEYRTQFPDVELVLPEPRQSQKPIAKNETLEEQTKRVFETLKASDPDTSITLKEIKRVLRPEYESNQEKKIREFAIRRVNASIAGSGGGHSQAQLEKFVEEEIVVIKEEKAERKRKNWEAYKRLLS